MKITIKYLLFFVLMLMSVSSMCWSMQLSELYTMNEKDRVWYLAGVYDANLSNWNDNGKSSNCLEKMGFKGFILNISSFITKLPENKESKERKAFDQMNTAAVAWLVIQKECKI